MAVGFTVKIVERASYRVVPEDPEIGAGINVPYEVEESTAVFVPPLRITADLEGTGRTSLRDGGWARYERGVLVEVYVPEGWRLEQWGEGEGAVTFADELGERDR